jgi:membrane protease YdiL (CAAX protease family)
MKQKICYLLFENECDPGWYWYLKQVCSEEVLFRLILCWGISSYTGNYLAILLSSVVYGLSHFILFRWQMVVASVMLGVILGKIFLSIDNVILALIVVVVIHYIVGTACVLLGLTSKWSRKE